MSLGIVALIAAVGGTVFTVQYLNDKKQERDTKIDIDATKNSSFAVTGNLLNMEGEYAVKLDKPMNFYAVNGYGKEELKEGENYLYVLESPEREGVLENVPADEEITITGKIQIMGTHVCIQAVSERILHFRWIYRYTYGQKDARF